LYVSKKLCLWIHPTNPFVFDHQGDGEVIKCAPWRVGVNGGMALYNNGIKSYDKNH
jgi:hypothetical protein